LTDLSEFRGFIPTVFFFFPVRDFFLFPVRAYAMDTLKGKVHRQEIAYGAFFFCYICIYMRGAQVGLETTEVAFAELPIPRGIRMKKGFFLGTER